MGGGWGRGVSRLPRMSQVKYISSLKVKSRQIPNIKFPTDVCTGTGLVYNRLRPHAMVRAV